MAKPKGEKIGLFEFSQMFPDEEAAEKFFENERWGESGRYCPRCGSFRTVERKKRKPLPYRCKDCRKDFSIRTGSVMRRSHVSLDKWLLAMYLLSTSLEGISSRKLASDLSIKQDAAWLLAHKIRSAMEQGNGLFTNPAESDKTRIGGLGKGKREGKRKHNGRGTEGKVAVPGAEEEESKKVRVKAAPDTKGETLSGFMGSRVA